MAKPWTETFPPLLSERFHKMEKTGPCYIEYSIYKFGLTLKLSATLPDSKAEHLFQDMTPRAKPTARCRCGRSGVPIRTSQGRGPETTDLPGAEGSHQARLATPNHEQKHWLRTQKLYHSIYIYIKWSPPWVNRHWWPHLYLLGSNHLTLRRLGNLPCSPFTCEDYTTVVCSYFK